MYNFQEIYDLLNKYKISEKIHNEDDLSNKLGIDLNNSNKIKDERIEAINNLGKKILNDTCDELNRIVDK